MSIVTINHSVECFVQHTYESDTESLKSHLFMGSDNCKRASSHQDIVNTMHILQSGALIGSPAPIPLNLTHLSQWWATMELGMNLELLLNQLWDINVIILFSWLSTVRKVAQEHSTILGSKVGSIFQSSVQSCSPVHRFKIKAGTNTYMCLMCFYCVNLLRSPLFILNGRYSQLPTESVKNSIRWLL